MRIIKLKSAMERTCSKCGSVLEVEESDLTFYRDLYECNAIGGMYACPGCAQQASIWQYEMPSVWTNNAIKEGRVKSYEEIIKAMHQ